MNRPSLIGNRVLLSPVDLKEQTTAAGVIVPASKNQTNHYYRVCGLGRGTWERRKGKPDRWIEPEVKMGDVVLSAHWRNEPLPGWHRTDYGQSEDQRSDIICDARNIVAVVGV